MAPGAEALNHLTEASSAPSLLAADGWQRQVGIEIKFIGPSARAAAEALAQALGESCWDEDPHAYRIDTEALGLMRIGADVRHVHPARSPISP
jgi:hypothetical protein